MLTSNLNFSLFPKAFLGLSYKQEVTNEESKELLELSDHTNFNFNVTGEVKTLTEFAKKSLKC